MNAASDRVDSARVETESSIYELWHIDSDKSPSLRGGSDLMDPWDPYGNWTSCYGAKNETGAYCVTISSDNPMLPYPEQYCPVYAGTGPSPFTLFDGFRLNASASGATLPVPLANVSDCKGVTAGSYTYSEYTRPEYDMFNNYAVKEQASVCKDSSGAYPPDNSSIAARFWQMNNATIAQVDALPPCPSPSPSSGDKPLSQGQITGIAFGATGAVALVIAGYWANRCRKARAVTATDLNVPLTQG